MFGFKGLLSALGLENQYEEIVGCLLIIFVDI